MATRREFKSDAFEAIHSSATALHRVGAIDKTTAQRFESHRHRRRSRRGGEVAPAHLRNGRRVWCYPSRFQIARYLPTTQCTRDIWRLFGPDGSFGTASLVRRCLDEEC
jgi:putative transcriptional regulator